MLILKQLHQLKSCVIVLTKTYKSFDIISFVDHYLNYAGFNHIIILDNETTVCNIAETFKNNSKITVIKISNAELQKTTHAELLHKIMLENKDKFDYFFPIDDDEYLWFNKNKYPTIKYFLKTINKYNIEYFHVPWRLISYCNKDRPVERTKPFKDECFYGLDFSNYHVCGKIFIKSSAIKQNDVFSLHIYWDKQIYHNLISYDINKFDYDLNNYNDKDLILYHYFHRTVNEWEEKLNRLDPIHGMKKTMRQEKQETKCVTLTTDFWINYKIYINPFNI